MHCMARAGHASAKAGQDVLGFIYGGAMLPGRFNGALPFQPDAQLHTASPRGLHSSARTTPFVFMPWRNSAGRGAVRVMRSPVVGWVKVRE